MNCGSQLQQNVNPSPELWFVKDCPGLKVDQTTFVKTSRFLLELMTLDFLLYNNSLTCGKEVPTGGSMQMIGKTLLKSF